MSTSLAEIEAGLSPAARNKADAVEADLLRQIEGLQTLRVALGHTQTELAKNMKTSQANVAKLEQRADMLLSTLRRHLQGMGCDLDLVVRLPHHGAVVLAGIGDIPEPERPVQKTQKAQKTSNTHREPEYA